MPRSISKPVYFFHEPRLSMTTAGRMFVRLAGDLGILLLFAAVFAFAVSDLLWLNWLALFLALCVADYLVHFEDADLPLRSMPDTGEINLARYLAPRGYRALEHSYERSTFLKENFFLELAHELSRTAEVRDALRRLDIPPEEFEQKTEELQALSRAGEAKQKNAVREEIENLIAAAFVVAQKENHRSIGVADLFAALAHMEEEFTSRLFVLFSAEAEDVEKALIFGAAKREMRSLWRRLPRTISGFAGVHVKVSHRVMNRAWTSRPTPVLDRVSRDLTDLARSEGSGFMIGHEKEYDRLVETLARPIHPNALLIGEAGVGKETVVAHLAFNMTRDNIPPGLFDKRLVELQLSDLVAGATPDELHARLKKIVEEIDLAGNIVLYVPEIHNLVLTSGTAFMSAADALMPIILNNRFPVIGDTYSREFKLLIEPRSDFAGAFETIRVEEITPSEAEKVLTYQSLILESENKIFITFGAIKTAVSIARKYFHTKFLPTSAEELLKTAVVLEASRHHAIVGADEIVAAAEEKTNIPLHAARADEVESLMHLEDAIHARFIDQEEAVHAVADALREYRSGLARSGGPIATFLFVGPTGVGKTELSKILAQIQFGSEKNMVRFDMTEFQEKASIARFIGSTDGSTRGMLTEAVLERPYSLVLLDEFEKAHPDILNIFLQVFDDGRLTDSLGRTIDFQNTIVIATSNAHSDLVSDALKQGETVAQISDYLKSKLTDVFRAELLNRFSRVVVFKDLGPAEVHAIAELNLKALCAQAEAQGIKLTFEPAAIDALAKLGYEPASGARPLRRVIDERIKAPLAGKILEGRTHRGAGLRIVWEENEFKFLSASNYTEAIDLRKE